MANPEDLGRYRLKRLLGRGALGEVWEAADLEQQGAKVAVKIMHAADDELALARAQFAREARLASLMRHPNVVAVHDAGEAAGTSFMVMDMVEGKSLRAVAQDSSTSTDEKFRWLRQIGEGLSAMHRAGIAHRDLKPENVIIRADRTACVVDLGIAKWIKFDLGGELDPENEFEVPVSRPAPARAANYAPPEADSAELYDELGDQFAFGVLAYELLTGTLPYEGSEALSEREDVPDAVGAALDRARSKNRDERWDAMELLIDELAPAIASTDPNPTSKPPSSASTAKSTSGRPASRANDIEKSTSTPPAPPANRMLLIGVILAVVVLAAVVWALR